MPKQYLPSGAYSWELVDLDLDFDLDDSASYQVEVDTAQVIFVGCNCYTEISGCKDEQRFESREVRNELLFRTERRQG